MDLGIQTFLGQDWPGDGGLGNEGSIQSVMKYGAEGREVWKALWVELCPQKNVEVLTLGTSKCDLTLEIGSLQR